jgi:hypothetical protein
MPSRPGLSAPPPPKGAKPVKLTAVSMMEQVRRRKKHRVLLPILLTLVIVLVLIAFVVGYLSFASGIFRPSWAAGMYQELIPTRTIVGAPVITSLALEKRVTDALAKEIALHPTSTTGVVQVNERDLTGLVQSMSERMASRGIRLHQGQVVILPDSLEIFAEVEKNGHTLRVLGSLVPRVSGGVASLEWQSAKIGSLTVSPAFAQSLIGQFIGMQEASIRASFGNATLESIRLMDGKAELVFEKR